MKIATILMSSIAPITFVCAMEIQNIDESYSQRCFLYHQTQITLNKGCSSAAKANLLVLDKVQQDKLNPNFGDIFEVGTIISAWNPVYQRNFSDNSDDDDDEYKPYDNNDLSWSKKAQKVNARSSRLIQVVAPRILCKRNNYYYSGIRLDSDKEEYSFEYYGQDALEEALKDLSLSYKASLEAGIKEINMGDDIIALSSLGVSNGVPRKEAYSVALSAIFEFIDKHPLAYTEIQLFVKKNFEYRWYIQWLQAATKQQ